MCSSDLLQTASLPSQQSAVSRALQQPMRQQVHLGNSLSIQQGAPKPARMSSTPLLQQPVTQQSEPSSLLTKLVMQRKQSDAYRPTDQAITPQITNVSCSLQQQGAQNSQPQFASGVQTFRKQSKDQQVVVIPDSPPEIEDQNKDGLFHHWKLTSTRNSQPLNSQSSKSLPDTRSHITTREQYSSLAQKYQQQPSLQDQTQTVSSNYHEENARSVQFNSTSEPANSHQVDTGVSQSSMIVTAESSLDQQASSFRTRQGQESTPVTTSSSRHMSLPLLTTVLQRVSEHSREQQVNLSHTNPQPALSPQVTSKANREPSALLSLLVSDGSVSKTIPTSDSTKTNLPSEKVDHDPDIIITSVVSQKDTEFAKHPPCKPSVSISYTQNGIVLSWTIELKKNSAAIEQYEIFTLQDDLKDRSPSSPTQIGRAHV